MAADIAGNTARSTGTVRALLSIDVNQGFCKALIKDTQVHYCVKTFLY